MRYALLNQLAGRILDRRHYDCVTIPAHVTLEISLKKIISFINGLRDIRQCNLDFYLLIREPQSVLIAPRFIVSRCFKQKVLC